MIVFTVHEPSDPQADRLERAAAFEFIRDGFSFSAAVLAPFWLLSHGAWLPSAAYVVAMSALIAAAVIIPSIAGWAVLVAIALHLWIGFEAASLRRWSLERAGWNLIGTVSGHNTSECERRFYDDWLTGKPFISQPSEVSASTGFLDSSTFDVRRRANETWSRVAGWRSPAKKT